MKFILCRLITLIAFIKSETSSLTCPNDALRYSDGRKMLAIENYAYKTLRKENVDGIESAMPELETLIVRNDSISFVEDKTFENLQRLLCLDLSDNLLSSLNTDTFLGLSKLNTLILRQNRLTDFSSQSPSFGHMTELESLDLSRNALQTLAPYVFTNLRRLQYVDFSRNKFMQIFGWMFGHSIETLTGMDLSENPLETLNLTDLSELHDLSAANTKLRRFPTFSHRLQRLNLEKCLINDVENEELRALSRLIEIRLSGNPWKCTCKLTAFASWLQNSESTLNNSRILCTDPIYMLDKDVASMNTTGCHKETKNEDNETFLKETFDKSATKFQSNFKIVTDDRATTATDKLSSNKSRLLVKVKFAYNASMFDDIGDDHPFESQTVLNDSKTEIKTPGDAVRPNNGCCKEKFRENLKFLLLSLPIGIILTVCLLGLLKTFHTFVKALNKKRSQNQIEQVANSSFQNNLDA